MEPAAGRRKGFEMSNDDLARYVTDELYWDPKVDSAATAVSAADGVVSLRGTVGSFREKQEAKHDAERIYGVKDVKNEIDVRILNEHRRSDAELRGAVLQAMMLDSLVPATIDAKRANPSQATSPASWESRTRSCSSHRDRPPTTSSTRSRRRWSGTRSWTPRASRSKARTGRSLSAGRSAPGPITTRRSTPPGRPRA